MVGSVFKKLSADWLLFVLNGAIFFLLLLDKFSAAPSRGGDFAGHAAIGTFEVAAIAASLYLLWQARAGRASPLDWIVGALVVAIAAIGFPAYSVMLFALYLMVRDRDDAYAKAAGTVVFAVAMQAVWAPLIFEKLSFIFLEIDARLVGWLLAYVAPGASSTGTIVTNPNGHNVIITAACASFHNLSLASLCWVTLTMLHRPYWIKSDLYIGLGAILVQFGLNLWRLVFVCMSLPMYEFWHEGLGKHIFSAVATASAIAFVELMLARSQRTISGRRAAISRA
jgi:hypothetical protein